MPKIRENWLILDRTHEPQMNTDGADQKDEEASFS
jgi:hypothetical protein